MSDFHALIIKVDLQFSTDVESVVLKSEFLTKVKSRYDFEEIEIKNGIEFKRGYPIIHCMVKKDILTVGVGASPTQSCFQNLAEFLDCLIPTISAAEVSVRSAELTNVISILDKETSFTDIFFQHNNQKSMLGELTDGSAHLEFTTNSRLYRVRVAISGKQIISNISSDDFGSTKLSEVMSTIDEASGVLTTFMSEFLDSPMGEAILRGKEVTKIVIK